MVSDDLSDGAHLSRDMKEKRDHAGTCRKVFLTEGTAYAKALSREQ